MTTGSYTLSDFNLDMVRLACAKCERKGQYRKDALMKEYGPDMLLPDLLTRIAQCTGGITSGQWSNCGAYYVDLVAED